MNKEIYFRYTLILSFIGLWVSLGSNPNDFLKILENNFYFNFKDLINFFRSIFPYIICLAYFFFIIKEKLYLKQSKIINLLLLIYISQIISTYLSNYSSISEFENLINHIGRYHWLVSGLGIIFIYMISNKFYERDLKIYFYISILFLTCIVIFFSSKIIYDFYTSIEDEAIYHLSVWRESAIFLNHEIPRLTGLSRSLIFLYIFVLFSNELNFKLNNYIKYFLLILIGSLVIFFQSKFSIIMLTFFYFLHFLTFKRKVKGFVILIFMIFLQFSTFYSFSNFRLVFQQNETIKEQKIDKTLEKSKNNNISRPKIKHFRNFSYDSISGLEYLEHVIFSGRVKLWIAAFDDIKNRPLIGYGSMADRVFYLNKKEHKGRFQINPISNAYLYALISGGIISLFCLIYLWFLIFKKTFNTDKSVRFMDKIPKLIIFVIFLRTIIENSMMIFGIDFILLINCLHLIRSK